MPLDRSDIDAALTKKGFRKGTHRDHDWYWLFIGETKQAINTKLSRGTNYGTIGDKLVGKIARQIMLNRRELNDLVSCTMSGSQYLAVLRAKNVELQESPDLSAVKKTSKPPAKKK